MSEAIDKIKNKLIVSVQAQGNEPLNKPEHLLAICQTVIDGGASGLRLCGVDNIRDISKEVKVPIIGLTKIEPTPFNWLEKVYISSSLKEVKELLKTNIDFIAIDGTKRPREDNSSLKDQIELIKDSKKIVVCDVSTLEEGINAAELKADMISTTLSGYTKDTRYKVNGGPDFELLEELVEELSIPVIMEGRIWNPEEVKKAFGMGAHAVVIGTSITRPHVITRRFVSAIPQS